jgi:hypothetical protein
VRTLNCVKTAVASLVFASAAVAGAQQKPQILYGTSVEATAFTPFAIATTVPGGGPRAQYVVLAEANTNNDSNVNGNLELLAWQDTTSSLVSVGAPGTVVTPGLAAIAITGLDSGRVVTADIDNTGALSINTWTVGAAGVFLQNGYSTAASTASQSVAIATLSSTEVVTAFVTESGTLAVEAWTINADGVPTAETLVGSGPSAYQVSIATVNPGQVVTAVGDNKGSMHVTTWGVNSEGVTSQDQVGMPGTVSTAAGAVAAGAGRVYQIVGSGFLFPKFGYVQSAFTPFLNPQGNVDVFYWGISASGQLTQQPTSTPTGPADFGQVAATMLPTSVPITAYTGGPGNCLFDEWYDEDSFPYIDEHLAEFCPSQLSRITGVASAAAGTDANIFSLFEPYNAYFVSGAEFTETTGTIYINVYSYLLPPQLPRL